MINLEVKIKQKLKEHSLTIEKLAVFSGVTKQTIHNIFKKNDIKLSQLERISGVLKVDLEYFLLGQGTGTSFQVDSKVGLASEVGNELDSLKRENDLLREMMELLKQKEVSSS
jgi:transcriptional regulator with XRE-family HTH domain